MTSNRLSPLAISLALACATQVAAAAPSAYQVVDLGPSQRPLALDRHGVVVGRAEDTNRADVFEGDAWTTLPARSDFSTAEAVNRTGDIVGEDGTRAVRWHHGRRQVLSGLGATATATGIADDGTIVGTFTPHDAHRCYTWKDGAITDLGTLGGPGCDAYAVDPTGQYVGGMSDGVHFSSHGFIHDAQGMHDLGALPNGYHSWVRAVNRHGHAALWADIDNSGDWAAAYWNGHRLIQVPGVLPPGGESISMGINARDEMLVSGDDGAGHTLFLYEGRTNAVTPIVPLIVNPDGWCFCGTPSRLATGIADDGRIVGSAFLEGEEHGYMLVPVTR